MLLLWCIHFLNSNIAGSVHPCVIYSMSLKATLIAGWINMVPTLILQPNMHDAHITYSYMIPITPSPIQPPNSNLDTVIVAIDTHGALPHRQEHRKCIPVVDVVAYVVTHGSYINILDGVLTTLCIISPWHHPYIPLPESQTESMYRCNRSFSIDL